MSKEQYLIACNIGANNETFPSPAITVATRIVRQVLVGKRFGTNSEEKRQAKFIALV